jgi:glutamate carboxypeptidase
MHRIEAVAAREDLEGCTSQVTVMNERDAWPLTDGTQRLADLVCKVGDELGLAVGQERRLGTSDSNFFGSAGVPTVDGLGPICKGYHTESELVYISSIKDRTILLANALLAVAGAYASGKLGA